MRIALYNIGCKVNYAETIHLQKQFNANGYEIVKFGNECDIVIINTCTVTLKADSDSRKVIRRAIRDNPKAFVVVTGCYAQLHSIDISSIEGVDAIIGNEEKFQLLEIINKFDKKEHSNIFISDSSSWQAHSAISVDEDSRTRAVLKIQDGCDYKCTYCSVAFARGPSRSVPLDEIGMRIKEAMASNFFELILTGINLGDWKIDNKRFINVLKMIEDIETGEMRFRISSIEPNLLTDEIIELVANSQKICPHFHIPLQSGSDNILKLMKRRYLVRIFIDRIEKIKSYMPDCCIGVDVICGFPGETIECFQETYDLILSLPISYLHVFTYSERKETEANNLQGTVSIEERKRRTKLLRELSDRKKTEFYFSQIGKIKIAIPEKYNFNNKQWHGRTENYLRVQAESFGNNDCKPVKIIIEEAKKNYVTGKLC